MHAHRKSSTVNHLIEPGSQRDPALNGRAFDLPPRRLAPSA
jgi:hypothetical protein